MTRDDILSLSEDSDIDIVVEFRADKKNLRNFFGFKRYLEKNLRNSVDLGIESALKPIVRNAVKHPNATRIRKECSRGLSPSIPARPREVASIMRLTQTQQEAIRSGVASVIGAESRIWLFGSRADDSKRGGDIDLFIETDAALPNRVASLCRLEGKLVMSLGERKIDILLKDAQTQESPLHRIAKERGVPL